MSPEAPRSDNTKRNDAGQYDDILARYVDRLLEGEEVDAGAILREHPDFGEELLADLKSFIDPGAKAQGEPVGNLGDYTLRRRIGRGGMGVVYDAWQNSLDRQVALKVLPAGIAADDKSFHRFMREAKTAAKLSHPHIVGVYGMGVEQNTPYYAMEFVDGETLAQIVRKLEDAPPEAPTPFGAYARDLSFYASLAQAFANAADALQHAHSKGVVHRDIKPSNLILDREGRLRILDFGLARLEGQESITTSGDLVGTVQYMSPEQAQVRKIAVDQRTDIYSLGATMYEVLTLRPPFKGNDHHDTLTQIITRDAEPPRKLQARVPRDLETIVLKCMRKDPRDRYGTAEALAQDLRRFARGDEIEARPERGIERFFRRVRRHRWKIAAAGALATIIVIGAFLAALVVDRQNRKNWERYAALVHEAVADLEIGVNPSRVTSYRAEEVVFGLLSPEDLFTMDTGLGDFRVLRVEHAVAKLQEAAALFPNRPEAFLYLARGLQGLGRMDESELALKAALAADSRFVPALLYATRLRKSTGSTETNVAMLDTLRAAADVEWKVRLIDAHKAAIGGDWHKALTLTESMLASAGGPEPYVGYELELLLKAGRLALREKEYFRVLRHVSVVQRFQRDAIAPGLLLASTYCLMGQPNEGQTVLDDMCARNGNAETAEAAVMLFLEFEDLDRALRMANGIADAALGAVVRARVLLQQDNPDAALLAGHEALRFGTPQPRAYAIVAEAFLRLKRLDEALATLDLGLAKYPANVAIITTKSRVLYYLCRNEEAMSLLERLAHNSLIDCLLGWHLFRLGKLEEAQEVFTRSVNQNSREWSSHYGLGHIAWLMGDIPRSAYHFMEGHEFGYLRYLYSPRTREALAPCWEELSVVVDEALRRGDRDPMALAIFALTAVNRSAPALQTARTYAQEAVAFTAGRDAQALTCLAEVQHAAGETEEAIRALERATNMPMCLGAASAMLEDYRKEISPVLASCASVDAFLCSLGATDAEGRNAKLAASRDALCAKNARLLEYLDLRLQESTGNAAETRARLERLVMQQNLNEEPALLRLAAELAEDGQRDRALELLEERCLASPDATRAAWDAWLAIAAKPPRLPPRELLARRPLQGEDGFAADIRWLLTQLAQGDTIRINCGFLVDSVDARGRTWGKDRFFDGGLSSVGTTHFAPPIEGAEDAVLFKEHRYWFFGCWRTPGYHIPLPDGDYEIALHFAEVTNGPVAARSTVSLEDHVVLRDFAPADDGLFRAIVKRFPVTVYGGALEVVLDHRWEADLFAIEVSPVGG